MHGRLQDRRYITRRKTTFGDILFFPLRRIPYPYRASTVFPSRSVPTKAIGNGSSSINSEDSLLEYLLVVDYRYARFALDPTSGLFAAVKCVRRSLSWPALMLTLWEQRLARPRLDRRGVCEEWIGRASSAAKANFIRAQYHRHRSKVNNLPPSGRGELVACITQNFTQTSSQVIHPFYVFQIASIILWSLDNYYYYAFCIALISAVSITTTLIDTRKARQFRQPG